MRTAVPEHKIVYIRFHKRIDALLTEFAAKTGMKRAAAVVWIQRRYLEKLLETVKAEDITVDDLGLSGIEEPYFIALGSGREGSMLGRGMQLTVDKSEERVLNFIAMQCDMSSRDLRTTMLVQYFYELGMLDGEV
ncbi:MAG: hypothetical protein MJ118_07600 [Clostridia bacterium]|nr:hypothetical protein [Clostridia bacterium]